MADLVIPTGFGLWTFYLQHAGNQHTALVTMGFSVEAPPYIQSNNDANLTSFATNMAPLWDSEVTFTRLVALIGAAGPFPRYESAGSGTGSRTSVVSAAPQVCSIAKKSTGLAGRQYRGRMYLPFPPTTGMSQQGQLTAGEQVIINAGLANWRTAAETNAANNVGSFYLLHATPLVGAAPAPTALQNLEVGLTVGTQRRRLERS